MLAQHLTAVKDFIFFLLIIKEDRIYNLLTDPIISLAEELKISSNQKRRSEADGMKVRFPTVSTKGFLFRLGLALRSALSVANFQIKKDNIKRKPLGPG